ncbi:hypothetical protein ZHAS_00005613 [Anopheles sinensis]|uniref:Ionotropic glutamate receptor L-glutamate and glycine-binding domain-containing protein n=1 Tax=Anopheles sinensis TaxID=74873 RepID=A0A084VJY7_ANOSI|nr:hypothetical protein ZHAS_00005613 [Anopheles sinensis]
MMEHHPCYQKRAKFVILVKRSAFADRLKIAAVLTKVGILNFIIARVEQGSTSHSTTVWTWNRFTKREQYFKTTDRPAARFFPNKLLDLHGYRFSLFSFEDYPFFATFHGGPPAGVLVDFINMIVRKRHNGTTVFIVDEKFSDVTDSRFNTEYWRRNYLNILYFREPSGIYIVCPINQKREFLQHLLKPFSLAIWIILGALFVLCRVLQTLFPTVYRYDLIGITFFGGGGTEYEQPFQFRIVTFALVVLLFFLSEAYNTKIISLMSFSKFYVLPRTIDELARSDFQILTPRYMSDMYDHLGLKFIPYAQSLRVERRLGMKLYDVYCTAMNQGTAHIVIRGIFDGFEKQLYIIDEPLAPDRHLLQFHFNSPFYELFEDYFARLNDVGIWAHLLKAHMDLSLWFTESNDALQEVIFFFDDLMCVWLLAIAGWLISAIAFVGELAWDKVERKSLTQNKFKWPVRP